MIRKLLIISLIVLAACQHNRSDKPVVTVMLPAEKYLLEQIVGDDYEVIALMNASSDPETFEPDMAALTAMGSGSAYLSMQNAGLETATLAKLKENFPDLRVIDISKEIRTLGGTHGDHGEPDPHIWASVANSQQIARAMLNAMIEIDPEKKEAFTQRHDNLQKQLADLDSEISGILSGKEGASFLIWHPSLSYFARDYGLQQIAVEHSGKEPSPTEMRMAIDRARDAKPAVFFAEPGKDTENARNIAKDFNIPVKTIALTGDDYLMQLKEAAESLK